MKVVLDSTDEFDQELIDLINCKQDLACILYDLGRIVSWQVNADEDCPGYGSADEVVEAIQEIIRTHPNRFVDRNY